MQILAEFRPDFQIRLWFWSFWPGMVPCSLCNSVIPIHCRTVTISRIRNLEWQSQLQNLRRHYSNNHRFPWYQSYSTSWYSVCWEEIHSWSTSRWRCQTSWGFRNDCRLMPWCLDLPRVRVAPPCGMNIYLRPLRRINKQEASKWKAWSTYLLLRSHDV